MRFSTSVITKEPLLPGLSAMQYERTPSMGGKFGGGAACRGFAPAPPRFNAFVPLPIGSFCEQIAKGGRSQSPGDELQLFHSEKPIEQWQ